VENDRPAPRNGLERSEAKVMASTEGQSNLSSVQGGQLLRITSPANWVALLGLLALLAGGLFWSFFGKLSVNVHGRAVLLPENGVSAVRTLEPGIVKELFLEPGDNVRAEETVGHLIPVNGKDDDLVNVQSQDDGFILNRLAEKGSYLTAGESLYTVGIGSREKMSAWLFVPFEEVSTLKEDMVVHLEPVEVSTDESGYLVGKVESFERFPASEQRLLEVFGDDPRWARFLLGEGDPKGLVLVSLDRTPRGKFIWTMGSGLATPLQPGMICTGEIRVSTAAPIHSVMSKEK
jgi:uncharacterized protein YaaQ